MKFSTRRTPSTFSAATRNASRKFDYLYILPTNTGDAGGRIMPPLLRQQKGLIKNIVWPMLPLFGIEAMILRQRFDTRFEFILLPESADQVAA